MADPGRSLDGQIAFGDHHQKRALQIQCAARQYLSFLRMYAKANELVEKIIEPVQTKEYGRPIYYYYHSVLQTARWDRPKYLGSLDIVKTAPTYAIEQAAIMVQGSFRRRQGWKRLMAHAAAVWQKTIDPTTGAEYYYNYRTGEARWEKPAIFGDADLDDFAGKLEELERKEKEKEEKAAREAEKAERKQRLKDAKAAKRAKKGAAEEGVEGKKKGPEEAEEEEEEEEEDGEGEGNEDKAKEGAGGRDANGVEEEEEDEASSSEDDEDEDDEDDEDEDSVEDDENEPMPREWPRSKSQLIIDKVEDRHYRFKQKRSFWPILRSAVFLGGFGRGIARLGAEGEGEGEGEVGVMGALAGALGIGGDGKTKERRADRKERRRKNKAAEAGGGGGDDDDDDDDGGDPPPPNALSLAINHLGLTLASSRMWEMGESLTALDLSHNGVERVSEDLAGLTLLRRLDLADNRLLEWPDDWFGSRTSLMEEMTALRELSLARNRLRELPISLFFNPALRRLDVSGNRIAAFPHAAPGDTSSLSQQDYMDLLRAKVGEIERVWRGGVALRGPASRHIVCLCLCVWGGAGRGDLFT